MERPDFCKDEHLEFLDALRESGATNMFGARPYLMEEFPSLYEPGHAAMRDGKAAQVLRYWMDSFGKADR